jgi:TRAP-type C4-dicarboxylate transport system permease small subunit
MTTFLKRIDRTIEKMTEHLCNLVLVALTLIVLYAVLMRYVFIDPPFWSDVLSTLSNVAMVLLGLSVTIRRRDHIAMQAFYEMLSPIFALLLDGLWNVLVLVFGLLLTIYGIEAVIKVPGFYWELGMLPEKVPMTIVPLSGLLVVIASVGVLIQDVRKFKELRRGAELGSALVAEVNSERP